MPEAVVLASKDPTKVRAGRIGAEARWGPPGTRTVKIGDLTVEQRRLVLALVDAAKKAPAATTANASKEVSSDSSNTTAS